jgi:hypothetical protein
MKKRVGPYVLSMETMMDAGAWTADRSPGPNPHLLLSFHPLIEESIKG